MSQSTASAGRRVPRVLLVFAGLVVVVLVALQFVRFFVPQFALDNPPVTHEVVWSSAEGEQLWRAACADCHSNETVYPWYSYVAPVGWLVAKDVHDGRREFNVSTNSRVEWDEMIEQIERGEMPLPVYLPMHPEANLTDAQKETLMTAIRDTFR